MSALAPPGYRRISSVCKSFSGGTPDRSRADYFGGDIPWIKSGEVKGVVTTTEESLTASGLANSAAKWAEPGAILVAMYGAGITAGQVARLAIRATTNQAVLSLIPNEPTEAEYLRDAISAIVPTLLRRKQGSGQPNLNAAIVRNAMIPWPEPCVRRGVEKASRHEVATAEAFSRLCTAKRKLKRGLAKQLLSGNLRFPMFSIVPWEDVPLGDLFTERNETNRTDLPLLSITADRGIIPRNEVDRRDTSNADKSKYKRVVPGDIAYNTMRMWQGVSGLSSLEGIVSPAYTVVRAGQRILPAYARHLFKEPAVIHLFFRYSQGLVDDTLNLKYERFVKITVRIPSDLDEQRRIAETLDLVDREIALVESLAERIALQRRGLMQKLLKGELHVPEASEAAE